MSVVNADRFTALKAKVKAEMLRRNQSGSVAAYGGTAYDYTVPPAVGKTVRQEHRDKLTGPMNAINSSEIPATSGVGVIKESELAAMETKVTAWAARSITDRSGSDCKSGCTGTCYTGCSTGCYGCGSGCPDGCSGCGSGCAGDCDGDCDTGCYGCGSGCPSGCTGCGSGCPDGCSGCGYGCDSTCQLWCGGDCWDGCDDGCLNTCKGGCNTGCSGGCDTTCKGGCSVSCLSTDVSTM